MKSLVLRYLAPVLGRMATICLPRLSGRRARLSAAHTAAPEEMPQRMPSRLATALAVSRASWSAMGITSSMIARFNTWGMNPAPMP